MLLGSSLIIDPTSLRIWPHSRSHSSYASYSLLALIFQRSLPDEPGRCFHFLGEFLRSVSIKATLSVSALRIFFVEFTAPKECALERVRVFASGRRYKAARGKSFVPRALEVFVGEIKRCLPRPANALRIAPQFQRL